MQPEHCVGTLVCNFHIDCLSIIFSAGQAEMTGREKRGDRGDLQAMICVGMR